MFVFVMLVVQIGYPLLGSYVVVGGLIEDMLVANTTLVMHLLAFFAGIILGRQQKDVWVSEGGGLMAFWKKRMVDIYSTTNAEEKFRIQELFAQYGIEYRMKVKDYARPNIVGSSAAMGGLGNYPIRLTTIFYVREEDIEAALALIHQ